MGVLLVFGGLPNRHLKKYGPYTRPGGKVVVEIEVGKENEEQIQV